MYKHIDLEKMDYCLEQYRQTGDRNYLVPLLADITILCRNTLLSSHFSSARSRLKCYEIEMVTDDAALRLLERIIKREEWKPEHWLTVCRNEIFFQLFNESKKVWNKTINETTQM